MDEIAKDVAFGAFLLLVGLATCWHERAYWRVSDELDRRWRTPYREYDSFKKFVKMKSP